MTLEELNKEMDNLNNLECSLKNVLEQQQLNDEYKIKVLYGLIKIVNVRTRLRSVKEKIQ